MPIFIIVIAVMVIVSFPFAAIWSLNTLFNLSIVYTFETWLAALFLNMITFGGLNNAIRKTK